MLRYIFAPPEKYGCPTPLKSILHHANLAVRYYSLLPFYYIYGLLLPSLCASHSTFVILHIVYPRPKQLITLAPLSPEQTAVLPAASSGSVS